MPQDPCSLTLSPHLHEAMESLGLLLMSKAKRANIIQSKRVSVGGGAVKGFKNAIIRIELQGNMGRC